jgi:hypothetical protein
MCHYLVRRRRPLAGALTEDRWPEVIGAFPSMRPLSEAGVSRAAKPVIWSTN